MTVHTDSSAVSISQSLDSLETTPLVMHRIWLELHSLEQWYAVIAEARSIFGRNWKGQGRVKRKLSQTYATMPNKVVKVWFDVPDPAFATWVAVKHSVVAVCQPVNKIL